MSRYSEPSFSAFVDRGFSAGPSGKTTVPLNSAESDTSSCAHSILDNLHCAHHVCPVMLSSEYCIKA